MGALPKRLVVEVGGPERYKAAMISVDEHPLLEAKVFVSRFPETLGNLPTPSTVLAYYDLEAEAPLSPDDVTKKSVRDCLRHGGYKPTGRGKPASEYLIKAVEKEWLSPQKGINLAVDLCNVVSLHSGLPISVVDAALAKEPLRLGLAEPKTSYVFNPSGQEIDIGGLVSLFDEAGPCGGPVKDSQRTKTSEATRETISVIWGCQALSERTDAALRWYRELLTNAGVETELLHP